MENRLSAITVNVADLIKIVQDNLTEHAAVFEDALAGFRLAANKALNERIDEISSRKIVSLHFTLPIPENHSDDYERVLRMLLLTKEAGQELIVLSESEQEMYVMNQWRWKGAFDQTSTFYAAAQ